MSQDWVSGQKDGAEEESIIPPDLRWNPGFPGEQLPCEQSTCLTLGLQQDLIYSNLG